MQDIRERKFLLSLDAALHERLKEFVARANQRDPMFKAEMGRTIVVALTQFLDAEEAKEREAA
jgi:hypothetical protein